jgi:hypothetical protein
MRSTRAPGVRTSSSTSSSGSSRGMPSKRVPRHGRPSLRCTSSVVEAVHDDTFRGDVPPPPRCARSPPTRRAPPPGHARPRRSPSPAPPAPAPRPSRRPRASRRRRRAKRAGRDLHREPHSALMSSTKTSRNRCRGTAAARPGSAPARRCGAAPRRVARVGLAAREERAPDAAARNRGSTTRSDTCAVYAPRSGRRAARAPRRR